MLKVLNRDENADKFNILDPLHPDESKDHHARLLAEAIRDQDLEEIEHPVVH